MKDVVRCDKLREGANSRRSVDFRMGQPTFDNENFEVGLFTKSYGLGAVRLRISRYQEKVSIPEYIGE